MRDYGRVYTTFWSSSDMRALDDDGKLLALYLLTSPHTTIIGAFRLPDGYATEDLGWSVQRVRKGFDELFRKGYANRCETTKWTWIRKFLEWNAPENPNQWKAARKLAAQIPSECVWKAEFSRVFALAAGDDAEPIHEPFCNGSETLSKSGSGSGSGIETESLSSASPPADTPPTETAAEVFEHWKLVWNHPKAVFDAKRRKRIESRLKDYTGEQLRQAISGYRNSPWHCGTDPNGSGTVYDSLDTLLQDSAHVEKGLQLFADPPKRRTDERPRIVT